MIEGGTTKATTKDGKTETLVFKKGQTLWRNATTHVTENVGKTKIHLLLVELKSKIIAPMESISIDELKNVVALSDLPNGHLQWILDHSEYHEYEDGTQIKKTGDEADVMMIILEGKISFYLDYHGRLVYYFYYTNDASTGGVGGLFPYSRMKVYPGCSFAVGKLRLLQLHKKYFPELEHLNPDFIQRLIGYMTERAKLVATTQMQHEKVSALGQLSAGIAHELNNPASAINRISSELTKRLKLNYELTEKLLLHNISAEHIQIIRNVVEAKYLANRIKLSALERMEKEDEITDWLEKAGVREATRLAKLLWMQDFHRLNLKISKAISTRMHFSR